MLLLNYVSKFEIRSLRVLGLLPNGCHQLSTWRCESRVCTHAHSLLHWRGPGTALAVIVQRVFQVAQHNHTLFQCVGVLRVAFRCLLVGHQNAHTQPSRLCWFVCDFHSFEGFMFLSSLRQRDLLVTRSQVSTICTREMFFTHCFAPRGSTSLPSKQRPTTYTSLPKVILLCFHVEVFIFFVAVQAVVRSGHGPW